MDSKILDYTLDAMGAPKEDAAFNTVCLNFISGGLATLNQVGVGDKIVPDKDTTWRTFFKEGESEIVIGLSKLYIQLNTQILFDPPGPSVISYTKQAIDELLWRIREEVSISEREDTTPGITPQ